MSTTSEALSPEEPLTEQPESQQNGRPPTYAPIHLPINPMYLPGGKTSLTGVSTTAFGLGIALGISSMLAMGLAYMQLPVWRAPFFIATLSVFHYLEFDMTARYNPPDAKVSSFLLSQNGSAYNIAHTTAMLELLTRCWLQSSMKPKWLQLPFAFPDILPTVSRGGLVALGMIFILVGQYTRSAAMATAGTSFNHIVQSTKQDDHILITKGIYAFSRHPSYFGFFWWGLGTQLVLGNYICFPAYAVVLWKFFNTRIIREEQFLVQFFGQEYIDYRRRTSVLIPFIS